MARSVKAAAVQKVVRLEFWHVGLRVSSAAASPVLVGYSALPDTFWLAMAENAFSFETHRALAIAH